MLAGVRAGGRSFQAELTLGGSITVPGGRAGKGLPEGAALGWEEERGVLGRVCVGRRPALGSGYHRPRNSGLTCSLLGLVSWAVGATKGSEQTVWVWEGWTPLQVGSVPGGRAPWDLRR